MCEALIGAVYLDGGFAAAEALVGRLWQERMRTPAQPLRDPKTVLQEWAQARGLPTPAYREVERSGPDHDPEFRVAVHLPKSCARRRFGPLQARGRAGRRRRHDGARRRQARTRSMAETAAQATRCGFVALIGAPNAGKSTLVNALVGTKVSIVTPKVQTTRTLIRGIAIEGAAQLIFVDTPGIFAPRRRLDRAMVGSRLGRHARRGYRRLPDRRAARASRRTRKRSCAGSTEVRAPKVLVLNKVDIVEKPTLLALAQSLNERATFAAIFMISALHRRRRRATSNAWFAAHVPAGPWLYPEDQISDAPLRQLAAEITREKLYLRLHQELPYQSTVETEVWKELKDGSVRIEQTIYVERESQRKIVLGKGGQTIKAIGAAARADIAVAIEQPVHLFLFVKVREGWGDDPERYREMGLEFPRE